EYSVGSDLVVEAGLTNAIVTPFWDTSKGEWFYSFNTVYSPELGNNRYYSVYMSPLMIENPHAVAKHLLIMQDGENLFTPSTDASYHVCPTASGCALYGSLDLDATLDTEIHSGQVASDTIVLGLFSTDDRENEYTPTYDFTEEIGGKGDLYLNFIADTVIPNLDAILGQGLAAPEPENIVLMGAELGGLISAYAGLARATDAEGNLVWGGAGAMSGTFEWDNEDMYNTVIPNNEFNENVRIWLDSGANDDNAFETVKVETALVAEGYTMTGSNPTLGYKMQKNGYPTEEDWGKRIKYSLQFFFQLT
ncbi:putative esterase, partial [Kipferlia bialata]